MAVAQRLQRLRTARSGLSHAKKRAATKGLQGAALVAYLSPYPMAVEGKPAPPQLQRVKETKTIQDSRKKVRNLGMLVQSAKRCNPTLQSQRLKQLRPGQ